MEAAACPLAGASFLEAGIEIGITNGQRVMMHTGYALRASLGDARQPQRLDGRARPGTTAACAMYAMFRMYVRVPWAIRERF